MTLRQYNADGTFIKTIFPYPSTNSSAQVSGFGVNNWLNGKVSPKISRTFGPYTSSTLGGSNSSALAGLSGPNWLALAAIANNSLQIVNNDGTTKSSGSVVPLVTSPAMPNHYMVCGPAGYIAASPSGSFWLMSGVFEAKDDTSAQDTGAWQDGQIFKINPNNGTAAVFTRLDSVPLHYSQRKATIGPAYTYGGLMFSAFHGIAIDDSGHVLVCDRLHNRISIYDTLGNYISGIPLKNPDLVGVHKKTGAIYAVTRNILDYNVGQLKIYRFPGWRNSPAPVCSVSVPFSGYGSRIVYMAINSQTTKPMIWLSCDILGVMAYQDDGAAFTLTQNWLKDHPGILGYDKIVVNRKKDQVLFNNGLAGLAQIEDWSNPVAAPCSTSAKKTAYATDLCMSLDNELYVMDGGGYSGPITRWTTGNHYLEPLNYTNSGHNMLTNYIYGAFHPVGGNGPKGMAVAPDKKTACQYMNTFGAYFIGVFADSGCLDSVQHTDTLIKPSCPGRVGGCLRYDSKGNLYLGIACRPPALATPSGFQNDDSYNYFVGSVARVPKGVKGAFSSNNTSSFTIADKIYAIGLGAFSSNCWCRMPTFDVDPYDRLVVPNAITQKVTLADNNGNVISEFGNYGNADETGAAIPMAFPTGAAASDNFIYVSDLINSRIVRVQMKFSLDNMPQLSYGLSVDKRKNLSAKASMSIQPNPFNPACRIAVTLPVSGNARLLVYDVTGRTVRILGASVMPAGTHDFSWDSRDDKGRQVPSGIYFLSLTAGKLKLTERAILSR
jgi:hypothetical protein